jgi:AcrR family transcriptional regulator
MPRDSTTTRRKIVSAADKLFYAQGFRAVSVDAIAKRAEVTKKTLYYHFQSKDELIAAYLSARDRPTLERCQGWAGSEGTVAERMERMFRRLRQSVKFPHWRGCAHEPSCSPVTELKLRLLGCCSRRQLRFGLVSTMTNRTLDGKPLCGRPRGARYCARVRRPSSPKPARQGYQRQREESQYGQYPYRLAMLSRCRQLEKSVVPGWKP